jgi:hypothetical protein
MQSIDEKILEKDKIISHELGCMSIEGYLHLLNYQYNIKPGDYEIEHQQININSLACPQRYYTKPLYDKIASHPKLLDEPLLVVRTNDNIQFYLVIGNTRAKVAYDKGISQLPAIVLFTYDDSIERDLGRSSLTEGGKIRHVANLEEIDIK